MAGTLCAVAMNTHIQSSIISPASPEPGLDPLTFRRFCQSGSWSHSNLLESRLRS